MNHKIPKPKKEKIQYVAKEELNLWRRGFTPQAEIWNGRMAMVGIGLTIMIFFVFNRFF